MANGETGGEERHLRRGEGITPSGRVVDPSDAVTGMSFLFGAIGAVAGIIVAAILSPQLSLATLAYCMMAALACGSAGVVTGGMVGATFAVLRGVTPPADPPQPSEGHSL